MNEVQVVEVTISDSSYEVPKLYPCEFSHPITSHCETLISRFDIYCIMKDFLLRDLSTLPLVCDHSTMKKRNVTIQNIG